MIRNCWLLQVKKKLAKIANYLTNCFDSALNCTVHRKLHIVNYTLHTAHCVLYTEHFTLHTVHCTQCSVHCTLYTAHCKRAHYTMHAAYFTGSTAQCPPNIKKKLNTHNTTMHPVPSPWHCTLYTIQKIIHLSKCTLQTTRLTLHCIIHIAQTAHYTENSSHCTLYTTHCTLYSTQFKLHTI